MLNIFLIFLILLIGHYTKKCRDEIKSLYRQIELNDERIRDLMLRNISKLENTDEGLKERCSRLHERVHSLEQLNKKDLLDDFD